MSVVAGGSPAARANASTHTHTYLFDEVLQDVHPGRSPLRRHPSFLFVRVSDSVRSRSGSLVASVDKERVGSPGSLFSPPSPPRSALTASGARAFPLSVEVKWQATHSLSASSPSPSQGPLACSRFRPLRARRFLFRSAQLSQAAWLLPLTPPPSLGIPSSLRAPTRLRTAHARSRSRSVPPAIASPSKRTTVD